MTTATIQTDEKLQIDPIDGDLLDSLLDEAAEELAAQMMICESVLLDLLTFTDEPEDVQQTLEQMANNKGTRAVTNLVKQVLGDANPNAEGTALAYDDESLRETVKCYMPAFSETYVARTLPIMDAKASHELQDESDLKAVCLDYLQGMRGQLEAMHKAESLNAVAYEFGRSVSENTSIEIVNMMAECASIWNKINPASQAKLKGRLWNIFRTNAYHRFQGAFIPKNGELSQKLTSCADQEIKHLFNHRFDEVLDRATSNPNASLDDMASADILTIDRMFTNNLKRQCFGSVTLYI